MGISKRNFLRQVGIGAGAVSSIPVVSSAAAEADEPVEKLAVEYATNDEGNTIAFTSFDDNELNLYLATGSSDINELAENITPLIEPDNGSIFDLSWEDSSTLQIWQNGSIHHLVIDEKGSVIDSELVEHKKLTGDEVNKSEKAQSVSPDDYTTPPGGGGSEAPDWFDDLDYYGDPEDMCVTRENFNVEWLEFCFETSGMSPKYYTTSCTGNEKPLVGASVTFGSLTFPLGSAEIGHDVWLAFDPDTWCIYFGSESAGVCVNRCEFDGKPTPAEVEDALIEPAINAIEEMNDHLSSDTPVEQHETDTAYAAAGLLVILILLNALGIGAGA